MRHNNNLKAICLLLIMAILASGCASSTLLQTTPANADVYIKGQRLGTTPYTYSDKKIAGASTLVTFKKEGYEDYNTTLRRTEHWNIAPLLTGLFLVYPLFWVLGYDQVHSYDLTEEEAAQPVAGSDVKKTDGIIRTFPDDDLKKAKDINNAIPDSNPEKTEGITQVTQTVSPAKYLAGEDDRIKVTVDSVVRSDTQPQDIVIALKEAKAYINSRYLPGQNNNYVLIYITINNKKEHNIGISRAGIPEIYLKDESDKQYNILLERGTSYIKFPGGGYTMWNPAVTQKDGLIIDNGYLLFNMPKNLRPVQMMYSYLYKENAESRKTNTGQLIINLLE